MNEQGVSVTRIIGRMGDVVESMKREATEQLHDFGEVSVPLVRLRKPYFAEYRADRSGNRTPENGNLEALGVDLQKVNATDTSARAVVIERIDGDCFCSAVEHSAPRKRIAFAPFIRNTHSGCSAVVAQGKTFSSRQRIAAHCRKELGVSVPHWLKRNDARLRKVPAEPSVTLPHVRTHIEHHAGRNPDVFQVNAQVCPDRQVAFLVNPVAGESFNNPLHSGQI